MADLSRETNPFRLTDLPEFNVFVFAFLLNYPWELMQVPLYKGMPEAAHWDAIQVCTRATLGDGVIMLLAFWGAALLVRDRWWIERPRWTPILTFIGIGVAITVLLERLAIVSDHPEWGWQYAEAMPIVPALGIGLTPFLQWVILPLLLVWFVKRQIAGSRMQDS
ncbi:hypothetical protein FG91_03606 [Sphingopyxis sp. LC81]|uniref:hypothetical protein n=1 Tax=Sphingopyxis sp. LC81 TaxID=1502850 RepID=UPI00050DE859|nr:hypothetical protein [Sphingopyxis sp. LC81]KGB52329.1 hypothetical protein FG91_03606 [Sphingopyxis sp. LC81]